MYSAEQSLDVSHASELFLQLHDILFIKPSVNQIGQCFLSLDNSSHVAKRLSNPSSDALAFQNNRTDTAKQHYSNRRSILVPIGLLVWLSRAHSVDPLLPLPPLFTNTSRFFSVVASRIITAPAPLAAATLEPIT